MNIKKITEYNEKFGEIPKDLEDRLIYLIDTYKIKDKDMSRINKMIKFIKSIRSHRINIVIWFHPTATPRARFSGRTGSFYVKGAKSYNDLLKSFIEKESTYGLITTQAKITVDSYVQTPGSMNKVDAFLAELRYIRPLSTPDVDNVWKTYADMMRSNLLLDDSLVCDMVSRKFYSIKPRVEITIEYKVSHDSNFNRNKVKNWKSFNDQLDRIDLTDYL